MTENGHEQPTANTHLVPQGRRRGRGAVSNRTSRYDRQARVTFDDGWEGLAELETLKTEVTLKSARSIISRNTSPDISFDQSINPYRGCEHGCVYCYARPTHAYLGLSPGLDFETQLFAKTNAADVLEKELSARNYIPKVIALGAVTDPYQPIEKRFEITRQLLQVLENANHPVGIVTKSALILRDIDILERMAKKGLVKVALSVTTLDRMTGRKMEPRASTPSKRLEAMAVLARAGVHTTAMVAPIIPGLNDSEIESILEATADAGAKAAGFVVLRLPLELKILFREWLEAEFPERASRVINTLRSMHGGKDYVSEFGIRQRGTGPYAVQIGERFRLASKRFGLSGREIFKLRTDLFRPPIRSGGQLPLF